MAEYMLRQPFSYYLIGKQYNTNDCTKYEMIVQSTFYPENRYGNAIKIDEVITDTVNQPISGVQMYLSPN